MKYLKQFLLILLSGITAILILNSIILFYFRQPVHLANPDKSTDYIWEPNAIWSKMTEGISWGKIDANGFVNKKVIENPDVLILGSSHMEAINVFQNQNTVSVLQDNLLKNNIPFSVYNKGISGHHFLKCCKYLEKNAKQNCLKYIIIETDSIKFSSADYNNLINDKIDFTPSYSSGLLYYFQKFPILRLIATQYKLGLKNVFYKRIHSSVVNKDTIIESEKCISENYDKLFSFIAEHSKNKKIIIFYHPTGIPTQAGNLEYGSDLEYLNHFSKFAKKYGIVFLDLTEYTDELWNTEHKTTHGFCTGTAFRGHMNKYGHRIVADSIADVIIKMENQNVSF